jgi:hypothetical protein
MLKSEFKKDSKQVLRAAQAGFKGGAERSLLIKSLA